MHTQLPDEICISLESIGAAISGGQVDHRRVLAVVTELSRLPADASLWAAGEISYLARLYIPVSSWTDRNTILLKIQPELSLIRETPNLEYLYLFHTTGHLREAALAKIDTPITSAFFFNSIVYRLNDWAAPVRRAAQACAARVFPRTNPEIIVEAAVVLLERYRSWRRWGDGAVALEAVFDRPDVAERFASWTATTPTGAATRVLRERLRRDRMDVHLLTIAGTAVQPTVRALALRTLIQGQTRSPDGFEKKWIDKSMGVSRRIVRYHERPVSRPVTIETLVELGAADRSALVRRVAADGLVQHRRSLHNVEEVLAILSVDKNHAVRERAEFIRREREAGPTP
jgi:hypothetical protein